MEMYGGFPSILEDTHEMSDGAGGWQPLLCLVLSTPRRCVLTYTCDPKPCKFNVGFIHQHSTRTSPTVHSNEKGSEDLCLLGGIRLSELRFTLFPLSSSPELVLANTCQTRGSITAGRTNVTHLNFLNVMPGPYNPAVPEGQSGHKLF